MYTCGRSIRNSSPVNLWICWLQCLADFWDHHCNWHVIGIKVKFFLIYQDNFNFEEYKSVHSWLKASFSFTVTPAHTWKAHSLPECLMDLPWLILLIILLQILMTLSDDSISHLEFMHIHISALLPHSFTSPSLTGVFLVQ